MKRAPHEKPEAIERLERFRFLLTEYRNIWYGTPAKEEFLNLWARSKSVIVVNSDKIHTQAIDP